ncbi:MAG: TonB-dependent receptor [Pseudomonadota bacterium]
MQKHTHFKLFARLHTLLAFSGGMVLASAGAAAQSSPDQDPGSVIELDTVVIESERVPRTITQTTTSVVVRDGEELESSGRINIFDAFEGTPNVLPQTGGGFVSAVRGIDGTGAGLGFGSFLTGGRPRFTTFIDGVPQSFAFLSPGQTVGTWGVNQAELLRGPQTTLQGRNAIAGALYVTTLDPSYTVESRLRVDGAVYPGNDGGYGRAAGLFTGPIVENNVAGLISFEGTLGESFIRFTDPLAAPSFKPEDIGSYNLRTALLFTPESLPGFRARLTYNRYDEEAPLPLVTGPGKFENNGGAFGAAAGIQQLQGDSISLQTDLDLGNGWSIGNTSTALWANTGQISNTALFQSSLTVKSSEFSSDLQLKYRGMDERNSLVLGGYVYKRDRDENDPGSVPLDAKDSVENYAVYGEGRIKLAGPFDLILGARLDQEDQKRRGTLFGIPSLDFDASSEAFLPMGGILVHFSDDITLGATVRTGYQAGGAGASFVTPGAFFRFDEEHITTGELSFRGRFIEDRLQINANAFYSKIDDFQAASFVGPFLDSITNIDKAHSIGLELEAEFLVNEQLTLFGGIGLLETEIDQGTVSGQNVSGQELPYAPSFSGRFGFNYVSDTGFSFGATLNHVGGYDNFVPNNAALESGDYTTVDLKAAYKANANLEVFAFANNVFDESYQLRALTTGDFVPGTPATLGIGVRAKW